MTNKQKKSSVQPKPDPKRVVLRANAGEYGLTDGMTASQQLSALATRSCLSASTLKAFAGVGDEVQATDLMDEMFKAGDEVVRGDLGRVERMMMNQAITLDAIFANLAERASRQEYMKQMEIYLRLALKAQSQARATAEALALLKNPQPYIKQANIANGHQQVNNMYDTAPSHSGINSEQSLAHALPGAGNSQIQPNKLLEEHDANILDTRAQGKTVGTNSHLAAVGKVHRPKVS